jgi:hypothetical protein
MQELMHFLRHHWLVLLLIGSGHIRAASFELRYLGEIGHLGTSSDSRTAIRFGRTPAVSTGDGGVVFQGRDDSGKAWQANLGIVGGIGFTTVWQADFDRNSRPDLLVAASFSGNGRCSDEITLSFLMFDRGGRPVPWVIQTRMPPSQRYPPVPAIFAPMNQNGRTRLLVTNCEFSDPAVNGDERSITGIYEAKDATWRLVRPARLEPYLALVRQRHKVRLEQDRLLVPSPGGWLDQGTEANRASERLTAVLNASPSCRGPVRLPPVVNGQLQAAGWKDPCDEIGENRIQLSDGTICYGWPTVIMDRANKREIVAESESSDPQPLLKEIVAEQFTVVLAGQRETRRCSPTLLWARPPH